MLSDIYKNINLHIVGIFTHGVRLGQLLLDDPLAHLLHHDVDDDIDVDDNVDHDVESDVDDDLILSPDIVEVDEPVPSLKCRQLWS